MSAPQSPQWLSKLASCLTQCTRYESGARGDASRDRSSRAEVGAPRCVQAASAMAAPALASDLDDLLPEELWRRIMLHMPVADLDLFCRASPMARSWMKQASATCREDFFCAYPPLAHRAFALDRQDAWPELRQQATLDIWMRQAARRPSCCQPDRLPRLSAVVTCLGVSDRAGMVAVGCEDGAISIWALNSGLRGPGVLGTVGGAAISVACDPDGLRALGVGVDQIPLLWEVPPLWRPRPKVTPPRRVPVDAGWVMQANFSDDGQLLLLSDLRARAEVWTTDTALRRLRRIDLKTNPEALDRDVEFRLIDNEGSLMAAEQPNPVDASANYSPRCFIWGARDGSAPIEMTYQEGLNIDAVLPGPSIRPNYNAQYRLGLEAGAGVDHVILQRRIAGAQAPLSVTLQDKPVAHASLSERGYLVVAATPGRRVRVWKIASGNESSSGWAGPQARSVSTMLRGVFRPHA